MNVGSTGGIDVGQFFKGATDGIAADGAALSGEDGGNQFQRHD